MLAKFLWSKGLHSLDIWKFEMLNWGKEKIAYQWLNDLPTNGQKVFK